MAFASRAVCLLLVSLALLCQAASAAQTAAQVVANLNELTVLTNNLKTRTAAITESNAQETGPDIPAGIAVIISRISADMSQMQGSATFGPADAQAIVAAYTTFVGAQKAFLTVLIPKHKLYFMIPYFGGIAATLRSLEGAVDEYSFGLIAKIPSQESTAQAQLASLDTALAAAIEVYEEPFPSRR